MSARFYGKLTLFVFMTFCLAVVISHAFEAPPAKDSLSEGPIAKLTPLLGNWEIDSQWADGNKLWARNEYKVGLGGQFVLADTYAKDGGGQVYHRYTTVFGYDAKKDQFVSYGFTFDGSVMTVPCEVTEEAGKLTITSSWKTNGDAEVKQTVQVAGNESYDWKVWTRSNADTEWNQIMDDVWKRVD